MSFDGRRLGDDELRDVFGGRGLHRAISLTLFYKKSSLFTSRAGDRQ
jgi:hypothetical protein